MLKMRLKRRDRQRGFTLTEIMVAVFIIGLLTTVVVLNIDGVVGQSRVTKAQGDLKAFQGGLSAYNLEIAAYPTEQQGLDALVQAPDGLNNPALYRAGGYLATSKIPLDPWNNPYVYEVPGENGRPYNVYTLGADGREGGEGDNRDISIWDLY